MANRIVRPIRIEGNIAYVPLTKGYEAIIDAADAALVSNYNWYTSQHQWGIYACRDAWLGDGKRAMTYMHRVILAAQNGQIVDHVNRDTLNNQRCNLRLASPSQNSANSKLSSANTSGLKGAFWNKARKCWQAYGRVSASKSKYLGSFDTAQQAHDAYMLHTTLEYGNFARMK